MKTNNWKTTAGPHLLVMVIFIALSYIYLMPLLQGKVLAQHDYTQAMGQQHEITEYVEKTGDQTLWTNSMFSGMPSIQIWIDFPMNLIGQGMKLIRAMFVNETDLLFLMMAGFYLLLYPITKNVWLSAIGGIAFAFGSFNLISIEAGHLNKVLAMAFIAPILGGILLAFNGRWLAGAILMSVFLGFQLRSNHIQITYYTMIASGILVVFYEGYLIFKKQYPLFVRASAALLVGALLAIGANTAQIWGTYDYSKATIRGGQSELTSDKKEAKQGGLTKEYAFSWSQGVGETFTILVPNLFGGGSSGNYEKTDSYKEFYNLLLQNGYPKQAAEEQANRYVGSALYWGGQPFTSGPIYFGAVVCFLFVLGMVVIRHPIKWALLAVALVAIMLSWGKNFEALNYWIFDHVPMYNKFRTPSMILTIANVMFVLVGLLALKEIWDSKDKQRLLKGLKIAGGVTAGLLVVVGFGADIFFDFTGANDGQSYVKASTLLADRKSLANADTLRSLLFIALAAGVVWAWITEKAKREYLVLGIGLLILVDLWSVSKRYLNDDDFISKREYDNLFIPSAADQTVLQDKDLSYRVLDFDPKTPQSFSGVFNGGAAPSYFHKSVGGYHAAKLRIYQELIDNQLYKELTILSQGLTQANQVPPNIPVLNMLNTRYFITGPQANQVVRNPNAAGNAWFVQNIKTVNTADEEMQGLSDFNPKQTAIIRASQTPLLEGFTPSTDPNGSVVLTEYKPDELTYQFKSANKQLVVFSEIYYPDGTSWKATIDGQPAKHLRVNYVLRALVVPEGEHTIKFEFEPVYYSAGSIISLICSLMILAALGLFIYLKVKGKKLEIPTEGI